MLRIMGAVALVSLGACSTVQYDAAYAALDGRALGLGIDGKRAFALTDTGQIASTDTVYVVAEEHGELHTYSLTPCRSGTHVCGGSGRVGHVTRTAEADVVTGAYPGRTFTLTAGGAGTLTWRGGDRDLAWD